MVIDHHTRRPADRHLPLGQAFAPTELTLQQLYWQQFGFGGSLHPAELEAALFGDIDIGSHAHDVVAQAINEALMDEGRPERAAYAP